MTTLTRDDPPDDTSSFAGSEADVVGSELGGVGGVGEGSSLGIPEDDTMMGSDVSVGGKEEMECTCVLW